MNFKNKIITLLCFPKLLKVIAIAICALLVVGVVPSAHAANSQGDTALRVTVDSLTAKRDNQIFSGTGQKGETVKVVDPNNKLVGDNIIATDSTWKVTSQTRVIKGKYTVTQDIDGIVNGTVILTVDQNEFVPMNNNKKHLSTMTKSTVTTYNSEPKAKVVPQVFTANGNLSKTGIAVGSIIIIAFIAIILGLVIRRIRNYSIKF